LPPPPFPDPVPDEDEELLASDFYEETDDEP
jgi:hypothetical protein